jgi:hypothetical protein
MESSSRLRHILVVASVAQAEWSQQIEQALRRSGSLAETLAEADAVVVVVGPQFSFELFAGKVRHTLRQALRMGKPIVPVLVDGARLPSGDERAPELRALSFQQALSLDCAADIEGMLAEVVAWLRRPVILSAQGVQSVFVSYRRDDTGYWAEALARALAVRVGAEAVFIDVGSEQPGRDYREQIDDALDRSSIVVVLIGVGFLKADKRGVRRIDRQDDPMRTEIAKALARGKPVQIVLVGQAMLPAADALPAEMRGLVSAPLVHRLKSDEDLDAVAAAILGRPAGKYGSEMDRVLDEWRQRQRSYETMARSVLAELATLGWGRGAARKDDRYDIRNPRFPAFRLILQVKLAEVALEERIRSVRRLGLPKWIRRAVFSVSPHRSSTEGLFRLPDRLLEASLDPEQFLARTGRIVLGRRWRRLMPQDTLLANTKLLTEPNVWAVESYQRTRRHITAQGGLQQLESLQRLRFESEGLVRGVAFHPDEEHLAIAQETGISLVSVRDWQTKAVLTGQATWQSLAFSSGGRLAAVSDAGQLSLWDTDGSVIADRVSPYSLWDRARAALRGEICAFSTVSISAAGDWVACCAADTLWLYNVAGGEFVAWKIPLAVPSVTGDYGAAFIPGRAEVMVFELSHVWIVELANLSVRVETVMPHRRDRLGESISEKPSKPATGATFYDVNDVAPSPRGDVAAVAGSDGQVALFSLDTLQRLRQMAWYEPITGGLSTRVELISYSPDARSIAAVARDRRRLIVASADSLEPVREARLQTWAHGLHMNPRMAWSPDASMLATNAIGGSIEIWQIAIG